MRYSEITAPANYPHLIELRIDSVDFRRPERFADDSDTFRILGCDKSKPDLWTVHIGCASEAVAERMDEGWN